MGILMFKKASIDKLTALLALPATGLEQDWDVELADASRIVEFVSTYERAMLSPDDKSALMALLLASVDEYLGANERLPDEWASVAALLRRDRDLHKKLVNYWAREGDDIEDDDIEDDVIEDDVIEGDDEEGWFGLTPHLRALALWRSPST